MMRQLLVDGRRGPRIERLARPVPGPDQILVRTRYSLVSPGTERHYIAQCREQDTRLRLGYCVAGEVQDGGAATPHALAAGTPVIAMGWGYACHAEYVAMPRRLVQPVPDGVDLRQALFANLLATAVHSIDRASLLARDRVLVVGGGLLGTLVAQACGAICDDVTLCDRLPDRCQPQDRYAGVTCPALLDDPHALAGRFTKAFLCIQGDASDWMAALPVLLSARGNGLQRPRIIGVGRFEAAMRFSVEMGNLDIVFAARCGEGYRDEQYVHGRSEVVPLPGEASVDANLARALCLIEAGKVRVEKLVGEPIALDALPKFYDSLESGHAPLSAIVHYE